MIAKQALRVLHTVYHQSRFQCLRCPLLVDRTLLKRGNRGPQNRPLSDKAPRYYMGKKIEDEIDNPFTHEYLLLLMEGYDEAVLDSYLSFAQSAAKMTDVNMTKTFNMPSTKSSYRTRNDPRETRTYKQVFTLKKFQRVAECQNVTEDKFDIFVQYLRENLPCGVDLKMELKRWEALVAPDHPALRKVETPSYTGKS